MEGKEPRGGERQRDRELVEEAVRWNRETTASERESREEIADSRGEGGAGGGINKVEETGVRHVGGDGRQRIPTGSPPRQTRPLFCPGAAKSWDAALFPYHAYPRLVETKSFDRSAVCHGAKNGNHTHGDKARAPFPRENFFLTRATEGPPTREIDAGVTSPDRSRSSRVQCARSSDEKEREREDFNSVWRFEAAVCEFPRATPGAATPFKSTSRCWPTWHRQRLVNSIPSYSLSRSRRCTVTWWVFAYLFFFFQHHPCIRFCRCPEMSRISIRKSVVETLTCKLQHVWRVYIYRRRVTRAKRRPLTRWWKEPPSRWINFSVELERQLSFRSEAGLSSFI